MCLYDLQKAFDSVEYPVLLEKLYDVGVNGKMWRLLKSWYKGGSCQVKVDGKVSDRFMMERGEKQGSVLSPTLFLLIMTTDIFNAFLFSCSNRTVDPISRRNSIFEIFVIQLCGGCYTVYIFE